MGYQIEVDVFCVVFDDELEDGALRWASEVSNALGARGGALPDITEDDDDVGKNKIDSASTTTTTLGGVSHATPQRVISVRRKGGNTSPPKESKIPVPFSHTPSDDDVDENLLILLYGLSDTHLLPT